MKTENKVAILQSSYIPWKGYFDIIHDVDTFIFYDDVQFTKQDWRTRNQIKTANGLLWLTVPAGPDQNRLIHEVELKDHQWQKKHWSTLTHAYGKRPYFNRYRTFFEDIYLGKKWTSLSELNQQVIKSISRDLLGLKTEFRDSRELAASGQKLDRLIDLVKKSGATRYVSGPAAKSYIDPKEFDNIGVELCYKDYTKYPEYPQSHPPFEHAVSILDALFNTGEDVTHYIWGWRND